MASLSLAALALACLLALCTGTRAAVKDDTLTYRTFRSPPISLRSGQIANTMSNWGPLDWVEGPIAIRHFDGKIVDESGKYVSLTEIYVHHWVLFRMDQSRQHIFPNGGVCANLGNIFGIGAELYHLEYNYPAPYAVVTTGDEVWTANMHLIRSTNVPDVQSCIECHCPDSRPPANPNGGIQCCPDQAMCWGMENSTLMDAKNYYLEYVIGYVNITKDVVPLTVFSMDVTSTHNTDCTLEYQVPAVPAGQVHVLETFVDVPTNMGVVYLELHLHIGGINLTVDHFRNGKDIGQICTATAIYGTGSEPGNESGYVVDMPPCHFDTPYELREGDRLKMRSVYDSRTIAGGHPWHEGVMGLAFFAAVATLSPEQTCYEMLHALCGSPPYPYSSDCYSCTSYWADYLNKSGCTPPMIAHECNQTTNGSVIPTPTSVPDVTLRLQTNDQRTRTFANLTGPAGSWFAFGINTNSSDMAGAIAWIYSSSASRGNGLPALQERVLGNHALGQLINPAYPVNVTTLPSGKIQLIFDLSASNMHTHLAAAAASHLPRAMGVEITVGDGLRPLTATGPVNELPYICFLFARGTGTMDVGYHGAARGWSCQITPPH